MHEWFRQLGAKHRVRDESAALAGRALVERESEQKIHCRQRWPAIIAEMRAVIARYNEAAAVEAVVLVENVDGDAPEVTMQSQGANQALIVQLDGTELCVRTRNESSRWIESERWISFERTDAGTAAYLLQHWMEQL